jgi:hypothetical protein
MNPSIIPILIFLFKRDYIYFQAESQGLVTYLFDTESEAPSVFCFKVFLFQVKVALALFQTFSIFCVFRSLSVS